MMTTLPPLAADWLARVHALSQRLPSERRSELLDDLREHLTAALPATAGEDEVRRVLARMGTPGEIVEAAGDDLPPAPPRLAPESPEPATSGSSRVSAAEVATLVGFVSSGLLLPVWPLAALAWLVAVLLLVTRDRWEGAENVVALLLPFGFSMPWVFVGVAGVVAGGTCSSSGVTGADGRFVESTTCEGMQGSSQVLGIGVTIAAVALLVVSVWGIVWLVRRARGRPATA